MWNTLKGQKRFELTDMKRNYQEVLQRSDHIFTTFGGRLITKYLKKLVDITVCKNIKILKSTKKSSFKTCCHMPMSESRIYRKRFFSNEYKIKELKEQTAERDMVMFIIFRKVPLRSFYLCFREITKTFKNWSRLPGKLQFKVSS